MAATSIAPWTGVDIGAVDAAGSFSLSNGTFTVNGSGTDIWYTADEFQFVSQTLSDDGSITTRVVSQSNTDPWAKAGLMVRETLTAGASYALTCVTPGNGAVYQARTATGINAVRTPGVAITLPYWVRVVRAKNVFTSYVSPDGVTWATVGTYTSTMAAQVYAGLAITSHSNSVLGTAVFDNVTVAAPGKIAVVVTPNTASIGKGATQQFTATVTNTTNTAVSWQGNAVAGGSASTGTISATGLYTAPTIVTSSATTFTVTAVSAQDTTATGMAIATVPATRPSAWSPVIPIAANAIAIANLPNGQLLMWSANAQFSYEADIGLAAAQTYTALFDPATNTSSQQVIAYTGTDMFCPGTAVLPDGRVLVNGGSSSPKTSIYNAVTDTWRTAAQMNVPRGYQGDTLLSSGGVLTLGGSWSGGLGGKTGAIWTATGGWKLATGIPETDVIGPAPQGIYRGDNHLWLFATSNGGVFHAGPSAQMNWITTSGSGSITSADNRGTDPYSINGCAVMFDVGKILKVGGAPAYQQPTTGTTYATSSALLIDISGGSSAAVQVTPLPPMAYQRAFANGVALPNGSVVIVGGQGIPQPFTETAAVLVPEIFDPVTRTFSVLKPMQTPRTYHSTAILLPDGRVFVGGGGQCGVGCAQNHLDAEIRLPPYLFNADGTAATRPVIMSAPTQAPLGGTLAVTTQSPVASVALVRLSAVTHTVNNDQRRIPLQIAGVAGLSYTLSIPADAGVVLPGYYMLFAMSSAGTPSVSTTVRIP